MAALDREIFGADAWSEEFLWQQAGLPNVLLLAAHCGAEDAGFDCAGSEGAGPAGDSAAAGPDRAHPEDGREEQLCGFAALAVNRTDAEVLTIASAPWARGRGIGRQLLTLLLAAARAHGVEAVYLDVRSDNTAAIGLYRSMGFVQLSVRRGYYADGDALVMRAALLP